MSAAIKMIMVEIPKSLSIHNIAKMKKNINLFSDDSLDIIRTTIGEKTYEELPEIDLSERLEDEHLFSLDDASKSVLISRLTTKDFIIKAVDEIIVPYLTGDETSVSQKTIYKKIGTVTYAVSFKEDYSYREELDYSLIRVLKASEILSGKL